MENSQYKYDTITNRTVMVSNLPPEHCSDEALTKVSLTRVIRTENSKKIQVMKQLYGDTVIHCRVVRLVGQLDVMYRKRQSVSFPAKILPV